MENNLQKDAIFLWAWLGISGRQGKPWPWSLGIPIMESEAWLAASGWGRICDPNKEKQPPQTNAKFVASSSRVYGCLKKTRLFSFTSTLFSSFLAPSSTSLAHQWITLSGGGKIPSLGEIFAAVTWSYHRISSHSPLPFFSNSNDFSKTLTPPPNKKKLSAVFFWFFFGWGDVEKKMW